MTEKKSTKKPTTKRKISTAAQADGTVRVWSTVGATLPIPESYGNIKFSFGHERIAKSGAQEEIRKTALLIDEFNEAELERRLKKYRRLFDRVMNEDEDDAPAHESVRERARKKIKK